MYYVSWLHVFGTVSVNMCVSNLYMYFVFFGSFFFCLLDFTSVYLIILGTCLFSNEGE